MQFSKTLIASIFAGVASLAAAQEQQGEVKMWVVKVGATKGKFTFEPNDLQAAPGEMVQFQFMSGNHSVVQSSFKKPCEPGAAEGAQPFWSGFMPMKDDDKMMPVYTIMVNDTKPIWFYCSQGKHCQNGMVGSINAAKEGNTLAAYTTAAKDAPANLSPGQEGAGSSGAGSSEGSSEGSSDSSSEGSGGSPVAGATTMATAASTATSSADAAAASGTDLALSGSNPVFSSSTSFTVLFAALAAAVLMV